MDSRSTSLRAHQIIITYRCLQIQSSWRNIHCEPIDMEWSLATSTWPESARTKALLLASGMGGVRPPIYRRRWAMSLINLSFLIVTEFLFDLLFSLMISNHNKYTLNWKQFNCWKPRQFVVRINFDVFQVLDKLADVHYLIESYNLLEIY